LIIAGSKAFGCEILILIISIWNKEELPEEWKESIIVPVDTKSDKTECFNYRGYHFSSYIQNFNLYSAVKINSICTGNYWGSTVWI